MTSHNSAMLQQSARQARLARSQRSLAHTALASIVDSLPYVRQRTDSAEPVAYNVYIELECATA